MIQPTRDPELEGGSTEREPLLENSGPEPVNYDAAAQAQDPATSKTQQPDEERLKDDESQVRQTPPGFRSIIIFLLIGVLIANADTSLVIATFGQIGSEFGRLDDSNWMIVGFQLGLLATQPMYGKLSDIFGRKALLLFAYVLFAAGCLWIGTSTEFWHVIIGRVISGIGGAGMTCVVSILLNDLIPLRDLAAWRSYVYLAATIGRSVGAPLGGLMVDTIGWRWSFLGQVPLAIIAVIMVSIKLHVKHRSREVDKLTLRQKFQRIDFLGATSLAASLSLLLVFIDEAGKRFTADNLLLILSGVFSVVLGIAFILIEGYVAKEPILSLHILTNRDVVSVYTVLGLTTGSQIALVTTVSIYFVISSGVSNANGAARLVFGNVSHAIGGLFAGVLIRRTGRYKKYLIGAMICGSTSILLITLRWRGNTSLWETAYLVPNGFGAGMVNTIAFTALSASVQHDDQAMATAGFYLSDNLGFVVIDSLGNAVFQLALHRRLHERLAGIPGSKETVHDILSNILKINELPGTVHKKAVKAFVEAMQWDHGLSTGIYFIALCIAAVFLREHSLD